ncbi:unnamed protein product [Spirodela intermedia]|uniref:Alpha-carbonic anhydrase domain-containing protein n=1 Tax=Spirodela intermedia TaxID=51605 RepID=A0A7I8JG61_SPIIN|nr:unnamed protein product [Spirodela intermedia]CAA6668493.1 unnamed protein product [Spirodela intermedia]
MLVAIRFVKFGYSGTISPDKWGELSPDYFLCSNGTRQSPINIQLERDYNPANATLVDNGFNVMLKYGDEVGVMVIDGKNYTLEQMHWHSPSEHTIDGVRSSLTGFRFKVPDGDAPRPLQRRRNISVVAVLYKYGHADPFLYQLKEEMYQMSREVNGGKYNATVTAGLVETKALRRHTNKYYRYMGSLSTPPVREISREQAASLSLLLEEDYRNNSRPTQPERPPGPPLP